MKVLAVTNMYPTSSRPASGIFVHDQVRSLEAIGVSVEVCTIDGRRSAGEYLRAIPEVRRRARSSGVDLVHAHYGLSGFVAVQQRAKPVVVSFCGSDLLGIPGPRGRPTLKGRVHRLLSRHAARRAAGVIVKSQGLGDALRGAAPFHILPNGVDLEQFQPVDRAGACRALRLDPDRKRVLFAGNVAASVKRYGLAQAAVEQLRADAPSVELYAVHDRPRADVVLAMSACDCLVLTSSHEGSPNVVKEAMACNLPVVSTRVGDVAEQCGEEPGHYLVDATPQAIAGGLRDALAFGRTRARDRIAASLALPIVAERLRAIYDSVLTERQASRAAGRFSAG